MRELKGLSKEALKLKLKELQIELVKISSQVAMKTQIKNPGSIKQIKKNIARIKFMLSK